MSIELINNTWHSGWTLEAKMEGEATSQILNAVYAFIHFWQSH